MPALINALLLLAAASAPPIPGAWGGESICQVRPSPCHDEQVVFRFGPPDAKGHLALTADKIVNGEELFMGTIDCVYDAAKGTLTGDNQGNLWRFTISGDEMTGTLTARGAIFRKLKLHRL